MTGPFAAHPGTHAVPRKPSPRLSFFRRLVRPWRRKQAPEGVASGAARTALTADRYPCCPCCALGSPCEPRDSHLAPCSDGCNDAALITTTELAVLHPQGQHPYPERPTRLVRPNGDGEIVIDENNRISILARTVPRRQAPGRPPWDTQAFPAVTDEVPGVATLVEQFGAEQVRAEYVRSQMRGAAAARDPHVLRQVLAGLVRL